MWGRDREGVQQALRLFSAGRLTNAAAVVLESAHSLPLSALSTPPSCPSPTRGEGTVRRAPSQISYVRQVQQIDHGVRRSHPLGAAVARSYPQVGASDDGGEGWRSSPWWA